MRAWHLLALLCFSAVLWSEPRSPARQIQDLQSDIEDLRQKVRCYGVERDILEEKFHKQESSFTSLSKELRTMRGQITESRIAQIEKRLATLEQKNDLLLADLKQLRNHANEASESLGLFNTKIGSLQQTLENDITHLRNGMQTLMSLIQKEVPISGKSLYKVKPGDSLERIAKHHSISVDKLKQLNHLTQDRILVGQELVVGE